MAKFSREKRQEINPKLDGLLAKMNDLLKEHGLEGLSIKSVVLQEGALADCSHCPCGSIPVILPGGRLGCQCKPCL